MSPLTAWSAALKAPTMRPFAWTSRVPPIPRRITLAVVHMTLAAATSFATFWIRFDDTIPPTELARWLNTLPVLLALRGVTFGLFRTYGSIWRYVGIWDVPNIAAAIAVSTIAFSVMGEAGLAGSSYHGYPRSILIMDSIMLLFAIVGTRVGYRLFVQVGRARRETRVLVFGAGDAGAMIVHQMKSTECEYEPVGFVDDDVTKTGKRIHGVPVLGRREDVGRIMAAVMPDEILVAIPTADLPTMSSILRALEPCDVPIKTLPKIREIVNGRVRLGEIRTVSVEDLLSRPPVDLDVNRVRDLICGKRVMVTGAGGSIGSELCRQIAAFGPELLVLYERHENSLYAIANDLADRKLAARLSPTIGDVSDINRVEDVLREHRPSVIFHAAAHKHVPLMEMNPCEAVKNNVIGTRTIARAAERHGVERFVVISTDKAVNPTSVMGATKRVAELVVQSMAGRCATQFMIVRFGNVLGSNGSVVPRFLDQVRAGGPVTVTHPEMRRYFMLIPEAVQLVLQAAATGRQREIMVLEMGEQVKLLDLAHNVIRLSGYVPGRDIPITFIGLRPGEKLSEELVGADEIVGKSPIERILRVTPRTMPAEALLVSQLECLQRLAERGDCRGVLHVLREIVPTFGPDEAQMISPSARAQDRGPITKENTSAAMLETSAVSVLAHAEPV